MLLFTSLFGGGVSGGGGEEPVFTVHGDGDGVSSCGSLRAWQINDMMAQQYQMPEAGLIVSMSAWLHTNSGSMRMGLYADSAGVPGALLAQAAGKSVTGTSHWEEFELNEEDYVPVSVDDLVWVCVQPDANINSCSAGSPVQALARRIKDQNYASGLLDPFGAASTYSASRPLRMKIWTNP